VCSKYGSIYSFHGKDVTLAQKSEMKKYENSINIFKLDQW